MNLKRIQAFIELIERKSFSEVADVFQISQPAVSKQIKTLEEELGVALIHRDLPELVPTSAGKAVYEQGKHLMDGWFRLVQTCKAYQDVLTGLLRIGASTIPGTYFLPSLIRPFHAQNPFIELSIVIFDSGVVLDMIHSHQLDIGIVGTKVSTPGLVQYRIASDKLVIIGPPDTDPATSLETALTLPYIAREHSSGTQQAVEHALADMSISRHELEIVAEVGNTEAVISLVSSGLGVSCVSDMAAKTAAAQGRVVIIGELQGARDFYVVTEESKKNHPVIRRFLDLAMPEVNHA